MSELKKLTKLYDNIDKAKHKYESAFEEYVGKRAKFKKGQNALYREKVHAVSSIGIDSETGELKYFVNELINWNIKFSDGSDVHSPITNEVSESDLTEIQP